MIHVYRQRLADRTAQTAQFDSRLRLLGYARLLDILAFAALVWLAVRSPDLFWLAAFPLAIFGFLVWTQSRLDRERKLARRAIRFYERGLARIENRWQGGGESGERFADPHHPYSADLDLFGRGSLFELLSTARTRGGEAKLASWLTAAGTVGELRARHEAVDELRPLLDLREKLCGIGEEVRAGLNPEQLKGWGAGDVRPFPAWLRAVALAMGLMTAGMIGWFFATGFVNIAARRGLMSAGLAVGLFAAWLRVRILGIVYAIHEPAHDLDVLAGILAVLETQEFQSARLRELRGAIVTRGEPASRSIGRLRRLMELIDSRDNVAVRIFGPPLLWTTQLGMALENWRAAHGRNVAGWLDAVSEIEALASLAGYAYEHPADPFPEFCEGAVFDGEELGHPLLADEKCVRNSIELRGDVRLIVISGSNMSGKSTLLRAAGVNAVLAMAGAPVRARRLTISRLSVGASIRSMDSLEEGHSRFMAEILRLKQILELPSPVFYLLDELLHGTNSHDRSIGAEGLIRALVTRGAIGLTSTHDLSLARVSESLAPAGINVHFDDRLENGRLVFDYRMKPGVVTRSNALDLMRAVGLEV